ncbi:MAG: hypothetical protein LBR11_01515 [Deltaproteobacteria bacterium]|nr:hypothetical protein [Deltaproteobacteria bacterium]
MLCPKCGYYSFDHNANCPKCKKDLRPIQKQLLLTTLKPEPINFFSLLDATDPGPLAPNKGANPPERG